MKDKKGFTLIELLTVIAILAVILLIAAPTILGVLEKSRKNTFKNQVLLYVEGLKQQVALTALNQSDMSITLPDVGSSTTVNIADIPMDTKSGFSGSIRIENEGGNYKYYLVGVQNSDYKVNKEVEARSLTANDIVKADGSTPSTPTYTAYNIGDQVTLKDNTVWYVIENSNSSSDTVTLFAGSNMKNDASGWTTNSDGDEYKILFDEENARTTENNSYCTQPAKGCNMYAANGSTVTEDSTIKKFVDTQVLSFINNSLTNNSGVSVSNIRLITTEEICNIINAADSNNNCTLEAAYYWSNGKKILTDVFNSVPSWLYSTPYWTMIPIDSDNNNVYTVNSNGIFGYVCADHDSRGVRPVIVTLKSNIK